jgi:hypothetical protein
LESFEVSATERPTALQTAEHVLGSPDVQAGSHPYALTTSFTLTESEEFEQQRFRPLGGGPKDVRAEFPPGFAGNPTAIPKCAYWRLLLDKCPNDTAIGEAVTEFASSNGYINKHGEERDQLEYSTNPVYNMETPGGVAAEFGYLAVNVAPILLDASVRTGSDYGITVNVHDITEIVVIHGSKVIIWGVPGEASHDALRGTCLGEDNVDRAELESTGLPYNYEESRCPNPHVEAPGSLPVQPFLTNPTSCGQSRAATLSVDGWNEPGIFASSTVAMSEVLSGCDKLNFSPTIRVQPDGSSGSTPTGLNVDVHVPQESTTNPDGLGEADVRDTAVTLPAGVQLSPSAADGLQACSLAQIGLDNAERPSCPDASKVATVHIATPLLEHELEGAVYLAAPQNFAGIPENPFSSLIAMYLVAEEPATGVLIKIAGKVTPNPETGQLTTTFENTPQLPFSDLKLEFFGTDRAPLTTPALCGTYTTQTAFTPWSAAEPANPSEVGHPSSGFQITSGPSGAPCSAAPPFAPSLQSGVTNNNAGAFTPLATTLSREDGQQPIQSVTLHYPPGVTGVLAGVPLCAEAQANAGACAAQSLIGETIVSVGLGNDPFTVTGGKVYLTEGYEGAPFGLSIVNPAKAGPFDLQEGRPVVVRAKIEVNPITAALTVTTPSSGEHAIPTIIDGIPLQIKHVYVNVERPGFTVNPTDCNPTSVTGTVASAEGASSPVSVPFQVTNCATLKFTPKLAVSTAGKASKNNGASLNFKIAYPKGAQGTQSWFNEAKFDLPLQLPARLTTLQKACLAATFDANPESCPAASKIGHVVVHTQVLPVPLEGPVYFVSYGGAKFPEAVMVLKGYGVTVNLHGETFISPKGITSATFRNTPDVPFESIEVTIPTGPFSEFGVNLPAKDKYDLCGQKLLMPTLFKAQNGLEIHQRTQIAVTGCPKAKKRKTPKRHAKNKQSGTGSHSKKG